MERELEEEVRTGKWKACKDRARGGTDSHSSWSLIQVCEGELARDCAIQG